MCFISYEFVSVLSQTLELNVLSLFCGISERIYIYIYRKNVLDVNGCQFSHCGTIATKIINVDWGV